MTQSPSAMTNVAFLSVFAALLYVLLFFGNLNGVWLVFAGLWAVLGWTQLKSWGWSSYILYVAGLIGALVSFFFSWGAFGWVSWVHILLLLANLALALIVFWTIWRR